MHMSASSYPIVAGPGVLAGGLFVFVFGSLPQPKKSKKYTEKCARFLSLYRTLYRYLEKYEQATARAGNSTSRQQWQRVPRKASVFRIGAWHRLTSSRLLVLEGSLFGQFDASTSFPEAAPSPLLTTELNIMSTHQPQSSTLTGSFHIPAVSSRVLAARRTEPTSLFGPFGESQQPPETPLRLMTSRMLHEAQTPEQTRSQASSVATAMLQSPLNLSSPQPSHPPHVPRATPAPHILQQGSRTTHSPFIIHRNPSFRPQLRPQSRELASPLQNLPVPLDSASLSFHTPSYAQPPDVSMTPVHLPRLTYSPSTLQSPVAVTPGPHGHLIFTIPGSGISWSLGAPRTPSTP